MYLQDVAQFSELGGCAGGIDAAADDIIGSDPFYFRMIIGSFTNASDLNRGYLEYRRYKTDLSKVGVSPALFESQGAPDPSSP